MIRSIYRHTKERRPAGCYPRSCLSPHISQPSVFRPDISCFTLLHHVLDDDQLTTSSGAHRVQRASFNQTTDRCGTKYCRSVRLRSARRCPSQDMRAHTAASCTWVHLGGGPSSTTNEGRLFPFFLDTQSDLRRRILRAFVL